QRFFGTLLDNIDTSKVAVVISGDHSTPCINKSHSDDPVPVLVSGDFIKKDGTTRFTEDQAKKGKIGLLMGADVIKTAVKMIKS
ncbi:MAG TPA: phosphoglycerate mutase, partial [Candidatus Nitrosotalea sp.]|nr:phosphoglycerate mutase [Candidatus Nitrosotalea sp.]